MCACFILLNSRQEGEYRNKFNQELIGSTNICRSEELRSANIFSKGSNAICLTNRGYIAQLKSYFCVIFEFVFLHIFHVVYLLWISIMLVQCLQVMSACKQHIDWRCTNDLMKTTMNEFHCCSVASFMSLLKRPP